LGTKKNPVPRRPTCAFTRVGSNKIKDANFMPVSF
jgi:hypothetical protein